MKPIGRLTVLLLAASVPAAAQEDPAPGGAPMHYQERPESSPILAYYDFEEPTPSGPDTYWVRQRHGSEVALSDAFRVGGERSLNITEVPGNRDFAEFLAYFRQRDEGRVFVQFYLLLTDPEQRFNFGLAGPGWFLGRQQNGHAVWLQSDGVFRHHPNEGWRQLFAPRPFTWYFVDLVWNVDRGTYDLRIHEEGIERPVVDLRGARGFNGHTASAVRYLSLIGDLEDAGGFDFFVDDLMIATHPSVRLEPFVAPGRRRLFVDMFSEAPESELSEREVAELLWQARRWLDKATARRAEGVDAALLDRIEAAADAAFRARRLDFAVEAYEHLAEDPDRAVRVMLKLSDVAHLAGDTERERRLREGIYGRLDVEE